MKLRWMFCSLLVAGAAAALAGGQDALLVAACPHCPPEQIVYQDVICHRCVQVPDKREIKKTVYEVQEVPFCLPKLPPLHSLFHHDCCCEECLECACPRYKKVLIKKEIVCGEVCGTKCVIEEFVQRVPCRVCDQPCPHCAAAGVPPAAPLILVLPLPAK